MNRLNDTEPSFDPRLKILLDNLKGTPPRDRQEEASGRARYLVELDELLGIEVPTGAQRVQRARLPRIWPVRLSWKAFQNQLAFTTVLIAFVFTLLVFGGAGVTVYAARAALPGDALYSFKTGFENTQVTLSRNAAQQAELHLSFAERRLVEIASLIADRRFTDINTATSDFEAHVEQAINSLRIVAAGDPAKAQALTARITSALSRYIEILRGMLTTVPDAVKPSIQRAILTSEHQPSKDLIEINGVIEAITPEGYLVSGQFVRVNALTQIRGEIILGSIVKVHARESSDGFLDALDIEFTGGTAPNVNANLNENSIDNTNENDNQNQDDQGESNQNDDHANLNENDNQDQHEEDDNSNGSGGDPGDNDNENDNHHQDNDNHHDDNNNNGGQSNENEGGGGNENGDDD